MISIIVPVYNASQYLYRCIESILNQTYKDFELILVDDGSTDESYEICKKYANEDDRIRVFHKENGGQSSARNLGLDFATGEYISFIDSDDWIHPQMLEILYKAVTDFDAQMSCCDFRPIKNVNDLEKIEYENLQYEQDIKNLCQVLSKETIFSDYRRNYIYKLQPSVCNKLIKRRIFDDIRFCEGMIYEDEHILMYIVDKISKCVIIDTQLYYYYCLNQSTIRSGFSEKKFSALDLAMSEIDFFHNVKSEMEQFLFQYVFWFISLSIVVYNYENQYINLFKQYKRKAVKYFPKVLASSNLCRMMKMVWILSFFSPKYSEVICNKYFEGITNNVHNLAGEI